MKVGLTYVLGKTRQISINPKKTSSSIYQSNKTHFSDLLGKGFEIPA